MKAHQLTHELDSFDTSITPQIPPLRLPSQPQIYMSQTERIQGFLKGEFLLKDLEQISSHLWMMSKQDSKSISSLHPQKVKGREVIVTEDPRLHLLWYHDRIFIKPLPKYLLSYHFWEAYLSVHCQSTAEQKTLRRAVLGYLRTYVYLIKHESDFRIADDDNLQLVPQGITFLEFCDFIALLENVLDTEVSGRYSYGEIRLTRLNLYSKIFLGNFSFHRVQAQYSDYFATFYGPLLFVFGSFSVVLSAMQLGMAVESLDTTAQWRAYWQVCRWFSVICLHMVLILALWLVALFFYKFVKEWIYAIGKIGEEKTFANSN